MHSVKRPWLMRWLVAAMALGVLVAPRVQALEAMDGRIQAHGYFEMQMRMMSADFTDQWDMTQWYNIFNLELEMDILQDTIGPLDLLSAYVRIEARFDCIYSRGCGMIKGVDVYGDRARRMPNRLNSGDNFTTAGTIVLSNDGSYANEQRDPLLVEQVPGFEGIYDGNEEGPGPVTNNTQMRCGTIGTNRCDDEENFYRPGFIDPRFWQADRNRQGEFEGEPFDDGTTGAPYLIVMQEFQDFKFSSIPVIGGSNNGHALMLMGPWLPKNYVESNATLAFQPNPLDISRNMKQSLAPGAGASPMRPIPILREDDPERHQVFVKQTTSIRGNPLAEVDRRWEIINPLALDIRPDGERAVAQPWEARGMFMPSPALKRELQRNKFNAYNFNFSETERAFNRGASQQDEGELKEAYLDIELFDSRLWLRVGKQSIVWGKTELFRTTDQFNPQDFALATLASLEESRINLWAIRGVYSFYEVGPFEDVRLELAMNFDQFESADLGGCGEPYTVNVVCALTFGNFAHGFTGIGVAGVSEPPNPWDSTRGIEFGGRLEFRWDRFSFALTDFYGFDDFPHPVRFSTYSRNVDWRTGRPRFYMDQENPNWSLLDGGWGCAAPDGMGVVFPLGPDGQPDFTTAPTGPGARVRYEGEGNEGCLYPGPTSRQVRIMEDPSEQNPNYGVQYRVPTRVPNQNALGAYVGQWWNDTARADTESLSQLHSIADPSRGSSGALELEDWLAGPHAELELCGSANPTEPGEAPWTPKPGYETVCDVPTDQVGLQTYEPYGRRTFDEDKYTISGLLNPSYNPYYKPSLDRYFDASLDAVDVQNLPNSDDYRGGVSGVFEYHANPRRNFTMDPVEVDPFQMGGLFSTTWWANAYDPTQVYDERNALDNNPINQTLFSWVCAATVGFSELDPAACAQTVFASTKPASDGAETRVSFAISGIIGGDTTILGILGNAAGDGVLSKGPGLPLKMAPPNSALHYDYAGNANGLNVFRTYDMRRDWNDVAPNRPFIYSREVESYNCLGPVPLFFTNDSSQLCGGLSVNISRLNPSDIPGSAVNAFSNDGFISKGFSPEQEALLGCGPFFGTSCDGNGLDLGFAEGSALVQSFLGVESHGISFVDLGIEHLVWSSFGSHLMDSNSEPQEYRTDGRVIGSNGELLRVGSDGNPELGGNGFLTVGRAASFHQAAAGITDPSLWHCDYTTVGNDAFVDYTGSGWNPVVEAQVNPRAAVHHRWNSRCWDNRKYYRVFGMQPGTSTFELLGLGGPKCTTPDLGGPVSKAGSLPGCRDKWATILYRPTAAWTPEMGLRPNLPEAGYIGNNHFADQRMSYRGDLLDPSLPSNPRTDFRQYTDPTTGEQIGEFDPGCASGATADQVEGYDCYVKNPSTTGLSGLGKAASVRLDPTWSNTDVRYAAAQQSERSGLNWGVFYQDYNDDRLGGQRFGTIETPVGCDDDVNDPDCYLGGWKQGIDGDPDKMGVFDQLDGATALIFPKFVTDSKAVPDVYGPLVQTLVETNLVESAGQPLTLQRVEKGCTQAKWAVFLQQTNDGQLLSAAECSHTFTNPSDGGAGHPFTGESYASEISGLSFNFMMLLVAFSDDFRDGLASVRGYVNPELYEARFIYDEDWMWDDSCTVATCGRAYDPTYGNPNLGPRGVRQVAGWIYEGLGQVAANQQINPLQPGVQNKRQRDPGLRNILTDFPDIVYHECLEARNARIPDPSLCFESFHWDRTAQEMRLGKDPSGQRGLVDSMLWDYAFTGTENDLMAMIPFCEDLEYSTLHVDTQRDTGVPPDAVRLSYGPNRIDCTKGEEGEVLGTERCTFITPQYCNLVQAVFSIAGQQKNVLRAGGGNGFGRRTVQWQSGGEIYLSYAKRNVLGFSMDFAEDYSKSSWGLEFTWIEGVPRIDNSSYLGTTESDDFNLTVSIDRPTFINFLNANRTFFINTQWFFQYRANYNDGMPANGPFNVLATLAFFTGYYQDRLNPSMIFVWDFMSSSGAALPQINYRFSESFSVTLGASLFMGGQQLVEMPVNGIAPAGPRAGSNAYMDGFEPGLAVVRDRDEVWMTLRYTF
jgi:hypothetical protein